MTERALEAAAAATQLRGLPERPVAPGRARPSCASASAGRCPTAPPTRPRCRPAGQAGRRRAGRLGRAALLRVRGRGEPARRPGRRLADRRLGPERRPVRARPGRGHGRGGGRRLAHRPARAAGHRHHRLRHRRPDGQRHRPGRGPPPRARRRRLGRGARRPWPGRRRSRSWSGPSATSPSTPPCASWAWAAAGCGSSVPTTRGAWTPPPCPRRWPPPGAGDRLRPAGNVNTGAVDPLAAICEAAHARGAWVHVDGAFGLWAAASPARRHLVAGAEQADSLATDAHKWLNVPYDSGLVFVAHPEAHRPPSRPWPAT